jgi:hypothetical protein
LYEDVDGFNITWEEDDTVLVYNKPYLQLLSKSLEDLDDRKIGKTYISRKYILLYIT